MRTSFTRFSVLGFLLLLLPSIQAQDPVDAVRERLRETHMALGLTAEEASNWTVTSTSTDKKGVSYVYIRQELAGLPVFGAVANFAVRDGRVLHMGDRLERGLTQRLPSTTPVLSAEQALRAVARELELAPTDIRVVDQKSDRELTLSASGASRDPIPARLIIQPTKDGALRLAWALTIRSVATPNWWNVSVDANTGELLRKMDQMVSCSVHAGTFERPYDAMADLGRQPVPAASPLDGSGYLVFPFPTESPNHGPQVLVSEPADALASPFGWHDTNGQSGAEYTITRGNNVLACEDLQNNDIPGYSPDGGANLLFDQAYAPPMQPMNYLDASITNMFYACNVLHDVLHYYGFDEESGNFQEFNYTGLSEGNDAVFAQAQDGSGMNNANFGTPEDGSSGVMQMYLWRVGSDSSLTINSPATIADVYRNSVAGFGPVLPEQPIIADLVLAQDATTPASDGCETLINASAIAGRIAVVDRGQCTFIAKVEALQDAGALAVIVVNNAPGDPIAMGGTGGGNIDIPAVMISQADGALIKQALLNGPVNATLVGDALEDLRDSGFDNGIIAHEYGHGVSNRLTGGPMDVYCLQNDEQMGEGWSDYIGMMLTMLPGDQGPTPRGVGTFVNDEPTTGTGIRPAPYSTDFAVNPYTYASTNSNTISMPHGIGFVWATMLWEMTWDLIGQYGYDPDMYSGTGGNNLALRLVMDGMKLQSCSPGFVDGRDAILLADDLLTGGENQCLIWNAFARRGLGVNASQGSSESRFDQQAGSDRPAPCLSVGVDETLGRSLQALHVFPNPSKGALRAQLSGPTSTQGELRILSADGRLVHQQPWPKGTAALDLDLSGISPAVYLLQISADGAVQQERFVME